MDNYTTCRICGGPGGFDYEEGSEECPACKGSGLLKVYDEIEVWNIVKDTYLKMGGHSVSEMKEAYDEAIEQQVKREAHF